MGSFDGRAGFPDPVVTNPIQPNYWTAVTPSLAMPLYGYNNNEFEDIVNGAAVKTVRLRKMIYDTSPSALFIWGIHRATGNLLVIDDERIAALAYQEGNLEQPYFGSGVNWTGGRVHDFLPTIQTPDWQAIEFKFQITINANTQSPAFSVKFYEGDTEKLTATLNSLQGSFFTGGAIVDFYVGEHESVCPLFSCTTYRPEREGFSAYEVCNDTIP